MLNMRKSAESISLREQKTRVKVPLTSKQQCQRDCKIKVLRAILTREHNWLGLVVRKPFIIHQSRIEELCSNGK